ncbi:MAG: heme biosynthesis protein HemY [Rhodoplanes sp.]|uniref:heme biosynthesis protein HemY n=1 Tax=Rhodoplanes sp. TaxID=1968906 RepID=UPI0017EEAE9C|nr:heme biosynthesis HemY N-terminal domain-containing protein [Rhodoplanes sp.]NVO16826.1 heme biosynthesis protein HemY [Rhodoplanes sp.]
MIRVLLFLVAVTALSFGAVWLADRPGDVAITWLGYQLETSIMVALAALAALVVAVILVWSILRAIVRAPAAWSAHRLDKRSRKAYKAISNGIVAIGAGDAMSARRFANEAQRLAPKEPLALLLGAQAAQLGGNPAEAERTFRAMAAREDTKLLGLHGLFIEAQRSDNGAAARTYAEDAARASPSLAWAAEAVLQYRCAAGDWTGALAALERNMRSGLVGKDTYKRQRAVLLTGRALSGEVDPEGSKALVMEALKLSPGLVPAASLAGRLLTESGQTRKAAKVVEAAWTINPHPDLAETYADIFPNESNRERLGRIRALAKLAPNHPESAVTMARAAMDAQEFATARTSLTPMLAMPTQRMAALMAELEEKEGGDVGRAREWMRRALQATRDPTWTADGMVSAKWMPASPISGRIDAFEWRIPLADLAGPVIEHDKPRRGQIAPAPAPAPAPAAAPKPSPAPPAKAAEPPAPPAAPLDRAAAAKPVSPPPVAEKPIPLPPPPSKASGRPVPPPPAPPAPPPVIDASSPPPVVETPVPRAGRSSRRDATAGTESETAENVIPLPQPPDVAASGSKPAGEVEAEKKAASAKPERRPFFR